MDIHKNARLSFRSREELSRFVLERGATRKAAAALQDAVDRICDGCGSGAMRCGLGFPGDGFLDKGSDLHASRLKQGCCFVGDVDG